MSSHPRFTLLCATLTAVAVWNEGASAAWYAKFDGVDGSSKSVDVGQEFSLLIGADTTHSGAGDFGGYKFDLNFDAKLMQIGATDFIFASTGQLSVDSTPTGIHFQVSGPGLSGRPFGTFASVNFKALSPGLSVITLASADAFNSQNELFLPQIIWPGAAIAQIVPEPGVAAPVFAIGAWLLRWRRRG
jgi:hypothetical protein